MEKKKLLLVAVSVGVVLFIIISIPLLIVSPRQNPTPSYSQERSSIVEAPRFPQAAPQAAPLAVDNTQNIQVPAEPVVEEQINEIALSSPAEVPQVTTITVQAPRTVAVPSAPVTRAQQPAPAKPTQAKPATPAPAKAAVAPEKPAPAAVKETPKPAAAVAAKPRVEPSKPKPAPNDFWVQTGAFSTQVRAEGAKESLASKGITSVIENRDIDGKTWYRVRVGPYVSETEAGYWLALVKAIDGFGDSQIRQSPRL